MLLLGFLAVSAFSSAQDRYLPKRNAISQVYVSDQGNGTYKNPVIHADYSDPDVVRVNDDYYLVSSSFEDVPGLPILHSYDLVNWTIIGHALLRQPPYDHFDIPRHGDGAWAPSIRYHNQEFYIYYPDPDYGIYLTKAKDPAGPWSEPKLVVAGRGLIDPCPLWDADSKVYLVHAFAGSRAGIKSLIAVKELNVNGTQTINEGQIVYDGHADDPTIEGPKIYKRNNYYYIFAPGGGVVTGWQTVLRSAHVYGPYERRVVMDQGKTPVNGPHQGAWVTTQTGEDWFIHFQDKGPYGRVIHLQPMKWVNDWPVIGIGKDGDGKGEPVLTYKKPDLKRSYPTATPAESDEFNQTRLGLQWQWQANPDEPWYFANAAQGNLRLYAIQSSPPAKNLWDVPNVLLQKLPAEEFRATAKLVLKPNLKLADEKAGLAIMGLSYADIFLQSKPDGIYLVYGTCKNASNGNAEADTILTRVNNQPVYLRLNVSKGAVCRFSYSFDDKTYVNAGNEFKAEAGRWIGAKMGIFCTGSTRSNDTGYADFDWFRVTPNRD